MAVRRGADHHMRFQFLMAGLFFGAALLVGSWIVWGPEPDDPRDRAAQMFFIEMPLFIILALVGLNALVRAGMGSRKR